MATFAKSTFNTALYALSRPTYPQVLFDAVFAYHQKSLLLPGTTAGWDNAVDLGCGTGQATAGILRPFDAPEPALFSNSEEPTLGFARATGIDPSAKMVQGAFEYAKSLGRQGTALNFVQGAAEDLKSLDDKSVDMFIAAQAAHWFDWEKLWPELSRVLRYGGTAAFWVYSEFRLPEHPHLTSFITEYSQGNDAQLSLGPHWEPGRAILNNHLLDIKDPPSGWDDVTRIFFTGDHYENLPQPLPVVMQRSMPWGINLSPDHPIDDIPSPSLHSYLRTFSALHRYHEAFPDDLAKGTNGDIAARFLRQLMAHAQIPAGPSGATQEVQVEWPLALVVARNQLDHGDPWLQRSEDLDRRINAVKTAYEAHVQKSSDSDQVEENTKRLSQWQDAQDAVAAMVYQDLIEVSNATLEPEQARGRVRYVGILEERRATLEWQSIFTAALDTAVTLADQVEVEVGRDDINSGVTRWTALMGEKIADHLSRVPMYDEEDGEATPQEMTEDNVEEAEHAQALTDVITVVTELANNSDDQPIFDVVRQFYVASASGISAELNIQ
ncbi:unnamed protein product [Mycena citricolor]|uniref:Methyltransferase type 11 domain-containing protein n=1 Tax=Mycena citricolor TaxID=2018698 RepID=A0AAD2H497_9AGAR|nr:unnamed protein product [Mycena citricolor]